MENKKHTPGPWAWSHAPMADYNFYVWDTKKQAICFWYGEGVSVEENRANARLIACAPELFKTLCDAMQTLHDHESPTFERARALIKKIEGGGE